MAGETPARVERRGGWDERDGDGARGSRGARSCGGGAATELQVRSTNGGGDEAEEEGFAKGDGAVEGGANGRSSGSWLGPSIHWIDRWLGLAAERSVGGGTGWLGRWDWIWEDPDEDAGESGGGG